MLLAQSPSSLKGNNENHYSILFSYSSHSSAMLQTSKITSITSISYTSSTSSARLQPSSPCLQDVGSKESGIEVSHHVLFCEEPGNRLGSCDVLKSQISSCFLGFVSPNGLLLDGFIFNDWFQQNVP